MTRTVITLPVFPLSVYLLPEGVTRLRIFERRYLKMVKIAAKGQGFVLLSTSKDEGLTNSVSLVWGSWVEIINFDQSEDGILEIDVKCKSLVEVISTTTDIDELTFGDVTEIDHWSQNKNDLSTNNLSTSLEILFNREPLLNDLYFEKSINNPHWVIARWLELLPISTEIKNSFIVTHSFEAAKDFVQSIFSNK